MVTIEEVDRISKKTHSVVISCNMQLNLDFLLEMLWEYLGLIRVYTKKRGELPDFVGPVVLTTDRNGVTLESACNQIHKDLATGMKYALVWGRSTKYNPQRCGLSHQLCDEDVIQVAKKTAEEQRHDKNYGDKVQAYYDNYHASKKKKKPLKS